MSECVISPSGVVVDTGSIAAVKAAKDLQESVLFPLSQEMHLNVKFLIKPLQVSSPSVTPAGKYVMMCEQECVPSNTLLYVLPRYIFNQAVEKNKVYTPQSTL